MKLILNLFYLDQLSCFMLALTALIGLLVTSFAANYLDGDTYYYKFFLNLIGLLASTGCLFISDHILLVLAAWATSNIFLVRLIVHKSNWKAAFQSGFLASQFFIFSFMTTTSAILLLSYAEQTTSLQKIISSAYEPTTLGIALILVSLGILAQSAIFPFQQWLISSLNAPTPVSALMFTGPLTSGCFLLARFSKLYYQIPYFLDGLFIAGLLSVLLGSLWRLIQSDIKRTLAYSTLEHMGYTIMLYGLGLFPAALTHLVLHAFFKVHLLLASSSAAQEKRLRFTLSPRFFTLMQASMYSILGSMTFTVVSHKNIASLDTNIILVCITFITGIQFALHLITRYTPFAILSATIGMGGFYGFNVYIVERILAPMNFIPHQPLKLLHIIGITMLGACWLVMVGSNYLLNALHQYSWLQKWYVFMLNTSQPHPHTVTAHRNNYNYL